MKSVIFCCALFSLAACSTSSAPAESPPPATDADSVCIEIAHTCHEYEAFSAKAKDCHEKGHSKKTTEEQCQAMRTECLEECTKAADAARGQGATETAPSDPGHDHPAGTGSEHTH